MEVYAILFFEAKTDTVICKGNDSKCISAGQTEQITNEKWADNIEDAKAAALAELPDLLCRGVGDWFVGVFGADPEGNDTEMLWEAVCFTAVKPETARGANTMSYNQAKADEYQSEFVYLSSTGETDEFSWKACPCCKSKLGGSRHEITGRLKSGEMESDWVCVDCAMYIVNGELPEYD